jgi:hypothetical protein
VDISDLTGTKKKSSTSPICSQGGTSCHCIGSVWKRTFSRQSNLLWRHLYPTRQHWDEYTTTTTLIQQRTAKGRHFVFFPLLHISLTWKRAYVTLGLKCKTGYRRCALSLFLLHSSFYYNFLLPTFNFLLFLSSHNFIFLSFHIFPSHFLCFIPLFIFLPVSFFCFSSQLPVFIPCFRLSFYPSSFFIFVLIFATASLAQII